jgi:hypothetical protein
MPTPGALNLAALHQVTQHLPGAFRRRGVHQLHIIADDMAHPSRAFHGRKVGDNRAAGAVVANGGAHWPTLPA